LPPVVKSPANEAHPPHRIPATPATPIETPALPKAAIRIEPGVKVDFSLAPRQPQQVHVSNEGDGTLHIKTCLQGADRDRFEIDPRGCGTLTEILPRNDRIITVHYKPSFLTWKASYSAILQVDHDAPNLASPQAIALRWTRVVPQRPQVIAQPASPEIVTLTINMLVDPSCTPLAQGVVSSGRLECKMTDKICRESFAKGTIISLTATPGYSTTFRSFSGACSETQPCTLKMTDHMSVTATFCGEVP
jgi:hypothetical protein